MTSDIFYKLMAESHRSRQKYSYSLWERLSKTRMMLALLSEFWELSVAMWRHDVHGPHGIVNEAVQCGNLSLRIAEEMERRG